MITTTNPVAKTSDSSVLMGIARGLLVLIGVAGLAGATYFTFFASVEDGRGSGAFDYFVALWKFVACAGMLAAALLPRLGREPRLRLATWFVAADLLFGVVKLVGYDETESLVFSGASLVLFGLLLYLRNRESRG